MRPSGIKKAETEAKRFLARAKELRACTEFREKDWTLSGSKETGALRRASLDLTRALAAMRKG